MSANQNLSPDPGNSGAGGDEQLPGAVETGKGDLPEREWVKDLPDALKSVPTLRKFTDQNWKASLAKSYVELESRLGATVQVPKNDAPAEDWEKFFSRVGRPGKPDEYDVPQGKLDKDFELAFRTKAHEAGLTKNQAAKILDGIIGTTEAAKAKASADMNQRSKDTELALRSEFGSKYEASMKDYEIGATALLGTDLFVKLMAEGYGTDPVFVKAFSAYGAQFHETGIVNGTPVAPKKADPYDWMRERYGHA